MGCHTEPGIVHIVYVLQKWHYKNMHSLQLVIECMFVDQVSLHMGGLGLCTMTGVPLTSLAQFNYRLLVGLNTLVSLGILAFEQGGGGLNTLLRLGKCTLNLGAGGGIGG